jgi:hypothetical protein
MGRRSRSRAAAAGGGKTTRSASRHAAAARARGPGGLPEWLALALILAAAAILHRGVLAMPFFADDYLFLEQSRGRSLIAALLAPDPIANFFRPVGRQLYFWLLARLSGESPGVFHAANLALLLGVVAMLFTVVRRVAGVVAATVAASFLALHYAADVPVRWIAGSQDLLAVLGALGAISLHLAGRRVWAALVLLVALLCKETALVTPLIAAVLDRRKDERWMDALRRAWPLGAAVAVWAALWLATAPQRSGLGASLGWEPWGPIAVIVHLLHVIAGLEWRGAFDAMGRFAPPLLPLVAVVVGVLGVRAAARERGALRGTLLAGGVWALAAVVPLVAVAATWSAYYYLYALCGVALALGALASRAPRWVAALLVVALAMGSASGRDNREFASGRGAWAFQSRVNRRYVERATDKITRFLASMKRARPTVPPRSTFFFGNIPGFVAWQSADGPVVRWAYRDTSLRSYYVSDFTLERVHRGPSFFFWGRGDSLIEQTMVTQELRSMALTVLMNDRIETSRDILAWLVEQESEARDVNYFRGWVEWAMGDTVAGLASLRRAAVGLDRDGLADARRAAEVLVQRDSARAELMLILAIERHALDGRLHGLLADVSLHRDPANGQARVEALAARALLPEDASSWLRWGAIQAFDGRHTQAMRSLEHALALGGLDPGRTQQVNSLLAQLRERVPGGALVQQQLSRDAGQGAGGR